MMTRKNKESILGFFGRYRFLSNFAPSKIEYEGLEYPSVEHAYQAAKSTDITERRKIRQAPKAADAKRMGKKSSLREDWGKVKFSIMEELVRKKFQIPDLKKALIATGDAYLEETNTWGDRIWGVCKGVGENHLGKILMKVRKELNAD